MLLLIASAALKTNTHGSGSHHDDEPDPLCTFNLYGVKSSVPRRYCRAVPSCTSLDDDGPASSYLELLRRALVGATALFSRVALAESPSYPPNKMHRRGAGLLINSGYSRMRNLQCLMQNISDHDVPGDFVECGIWRGGAVIFMAGYAEAYRLRHRVWGFDSFMGLPTKRSGVRESVDVGWTKNNTDMSVTLAQVQAHAHSYALAHRIHLVPGWFKESIPPKLGELAARGGISLLRVDGDLYSSTMQALKLLYPLLNPGGWVVLDDWSVPGARTAVEDFRRDFSIDEPISFHSGHPMVYPVARWQKRSPRSL